MRLTAANIDEKSQVIPMLEGVKKHLKRVPKLLEADRGYDSEKLRFKLSWWLKIRTDIPKREYDIERRKTYRSINKSNGSMRWVVERTFAWLYKKFRRLTQRWERKFDNFHAFLRAGFVKFWLDELVG